MKSSRLIAVLLTGLAVLVIVPSALAGPTRAAAKGKLVKQSRLKRASRAGLRADGINGSLTLRGSVGQTTFYTAPNSGGRTCYLIGKTPDTIATTLCPGDSQPYALGADRPVLDASFFHSPTMDIADGVLIGFYGFTTSDVVEVDLVAPDGSRHAVPLQDGLFADPSPEGDATGLVALDATGKVVYQRKFP
jgi:hypothetical protein